MYWNSKGISVYLIISIIGVLALGFILVLPQVMDVQRKENTENCLKNMREIENAVKRYMSERNENFVGDTTDLYRTGYLRRSVYVCPEGTPESRYYVSGDYITGKVEVTCPHVDEYPDHFLPSRDGM